VPTRVAMLYIYYCRTEKKAVSGGGGDGGHVLKDTTGRGVTAPILRSPPSSATPGYHDPIIGVSGIYVCLLL